MGIGVENLPCDLIDSITITDLEITWTVKKAIKQPIKQNENLQVKEWIWLSFAYPQVKLWTHAMRYTHHHKPDLYFLILYLQRSFPQRSFNWEIPAGLRSGPSLNNPHTWGTGPHGVWGGVGRGLTFGKHACPISLSFFSFFYKLCRDFSDGTNSCLWMVCCWIEDSFMLICLSFCLSTYLYIQLYLSTCKLAILPVYLAICLAIYLLSCVSFHPLICSSIPNSYNFICQTSVIFFFKKITSLHIQLYHILS